MSSFFRLAILFFCLFFSLLGSAANAAAQSITASESARPNDPQLVDRIIAVINEEVITAFELRARLKLAVEQLKRQGTQLPPDDVLEKQMLERLIMDKVQLQFAKESGLRVDDAQLEQTLQRVAAGNQMSLAEFRQTLQKDGIPFAKFRDEVRDEVTIARVREREVENKILISESEIDHYLNDTSEQSRNEVYEVAHILLRLPESASPEQIQKIKAKIDQIAERLAQGEDFSKLAAAYSDAPDALQGGNLGKRSLANLPSVFTESVSALAVGEIAPVLRSANGFHLIKLMSKSDGKIAPSMQQTHARHILIKVNELTSESEAKHKLTGLYERIKNGANFAELARLFSQDGSASKGGDLGWLYPGDTVPDFERVMNALQPGELSAPVQSPFGFHLIEVIERRVQDVSSERKRSAARQVLRERKFDEAYQDWLRQLRDRAYVEILIDEQ